MLLIIGNLVGCFTTKHRYNVIRTSVFDIRVLLQHLDGVKHVLLARIFQFQAEDLVEFLQVHIVEIFKCPYIGIGCEFFWNRLPLDLGIGQGCGCRGQVGHIFKSITRKIRKTIGLQRGAGCVGQSFYNQKNAQTDPASVQLMRASTVFDFCAGALLVTRLYRLFTVLLYLPFPALSIFF